MIIEVLPADEGRNAGISLADRLAKKGIYVNKDCGGLGRCGKCSVVVDGIQRKACHVTVDRPMLVEVDDALCSSMKSDVCEETEYEAPAHLKDDSAADESRACSGYDSGVNESQACSKSGSGVNESQACSKSGSGVNESQACSMSGSGVHNGQEGSMDVDSFSLAIDIGTTTIAIALVDGRSRNIVDIYTCENSQRRFGADVISRIVASNNGYGSELRNLVIRDINRGVAVLLERHGLRQEGLEKIAIAGNTTMEHIFAEYSCEGLGSVPFRPVSLDFINTESGLLLPGVSSFFGADALAGLYEIGMADSEEVTLFIDLGTNGEMAIGNCKHILVTSAAAGPAFEGGNISCGVASIPGAVSDVILDDDSDEPIKLELIGSALKPSGLCGTGVIALAAELLRNNLLYDTGLFDERLGNKIKLTADGSITFTQKDMRELQLAKAAVRAGLETLINEFGTSYADISRVCIAGSFGAHLNVDKAAKIGLIPAELVGKTVAVGNTSLMGTVRYLNYIGDNSGKCLTDIKELCTVIELAENEYFGSKFIEYMNF